MFAAYFSKEGGIADPAGTLYLPTGQNGLGQQYRAISKLLDYAGVESELEIGVSVALDAVKAEAEDFKKFSTLAAEIWDRTIDTEEFKNFVNVVEATCSNRTFYRKQLLSAFHLSLKVFGEKSSSSR